MSDPKTRRQKIVWLSRDAIYTTCVQIAEDEVFDGHINIEELTMSNYSIQQGDIGEPGKWTFIRSGESRFVVMSCPACGERFALNGTGNHTVHDDGRVTPSVLCDYCGLHRFVQLEGYNDE